MASEHKDDLEFALKVTDVDWATRELIETLLKLEDCNNLQEATTLAESCMNQIKELVVERYRQIVSSMKTDTVFASREERIKMQGGV